MQQNKKILILGFVWAEPASSAAGSRSMEFITLFRAQGWQVRFASAAALSGHRADLSALGVEEKSIALNCDSFDAMLAEYRPDIVLFDRFFTEEQFGWRVARTCPQALRVLDTQDLHSLRQARQLLLKRAQQHCSNETARHSVPPVAASPAALRAVMVNEEMSQREIAAIYRCDLTLMISDTEIALLQKEFGVPAALLHHCALMLMPSPGASEIPRPAFGQRTHFLSIGNFRHAPNWDSVLWLKHALWPKLRQRLPQAQLHVAGAYPPPKAMALHNPAQGFHVIGWVADAHAAMRQARVCLAPLRFGAGIKGKLADAMACGTPSVTTTIGSEGMHGALPWGGAVADDPDGFVEAAFDLYQDRALWQQAQIQGDQILQQRFERPRIAAELIMALQQAEQHCAERRQANFVGLMLHHHQHRSTQYMSQWIAEKNRLAAVDGALPAAE
ncbi:glycosyltransferase [Undibacterium sp. Jales W-56]|uniref:glycosyltransferase n=1 Tax=Undibacterium sp. Jales W-56 TaxID=2897325 RepID=UPI0021CF065B|nr:glycosyltransferase [Undibacterium sp. Jales W-56]MCU6434247.1 glycosyltransferase [Undibacterium sp. Jales W-56]